jgi:translation initiation factor 1 (eIF-1/SUI1)
MIDTGQLAAWLKSSFPAGTGLGNAAIEVQVIQAQIFFAII